MGLGDWFRRLFSPSPTSRSPEDDAILREEYGGGASESSEPGGVVAGGVSGLAGLEDAEAAEEDLDQFEPPRDPAP
jgi:hypothetical protein